ncbi:cell division ATP-binding protein FtsE [Flaviflexus massiliensis]|uniref:cell division ATP-binding protein FtsE n=1 Tax=Flaviflexus massiliensis TaxID=1522309 RepID=UPI0006D5AD08|nr:cell division ATP-binding protein FtsE [Flaviflexus massiliensis]
MITFQNVTKIYQKGAHPALDDVTLDIERGEFVFLVGPSGSGKSTFLRLCMLEEQATSGKIFVLGKNLAELSSRRTPKLRRQVGRVFQEFRLLEDKNVFDNVALAMQVIGRPRHHIRSAVPEVLDMVGLGGKEKRKMTELSGGELQRVAIARAMVNRPKLLLADEPTGNLDRNTASGIMSLLDRINRNGTTVVMATHAYDIVNEMRKRVVTLSDGVVVSDQERGMYGTGGQA